MAGIMDSVEMPKLSENQKSFAGIPEAIFLVRNTYRSNLKICFQFGANRRNYSLIH